MPQKFFLALADRQVPAHVAAHDKLRLLRQLQGVGYLDVRFFPQESTTDQFAELRSMTPLGRRVLDIVTRTDSALR